MRTLFECGLKHMLDGQTSVDEVLRVTDVPKAEDAATGIGASKPKGKGKGKGKGGTSAVRPAAPEGATDEFEVVDGFDPDEMLAGLELVDEPSASGPAAVAGDQTTILVVEDEDSLRRVLKDLLEMEGYTVCEARDGAEAIEQVDRHNPDLMLLDLNLPNVDGFTVIRKLRAELNTADLPIVVLTARGDEDNEVKVLKAGGTDFVAKPFRPKPLLARIAATLARNRK